MSLLVPSTHGIGAKVDVLTKAPPAWHSPWHIVFGGRGYALASAVAQSTMLAIWSMLHNRKTGGPTAR